VEEPSEITAQISMMTGNIHIQTPTDTQVRFNADTANARPVPTTARNAYLRSWGARVSWVFSALSMAPSAINGTTDANKSGTAQETIPTKTDT